MPAGLAREEAATADDGGWQWIARGVEQLGTGIAEKCAIHVQGIGQTEGADAVASTRIDADQRQIKASRMATFAGLGRRDDGQVVRVGFPPETLDIQPLLQTERTVDPRS